MDILIVNFTLDGMTNPEYRALCDQIAPAFAEVPGLVSEGGLADPAGGVYGGVYTFEDRAMLEAYLESDLFAQAGATPGLTNFSLQRFDVIPAPTAVTRGGTLAVASCGWDHEQHG